MNQVRKINTNEEHDEIYPINTVINTGVDNTRKILIVEDDGFFRELLISYAKLFYSKIYIFSNAEATNFFISNSTSSFDTVLLDYFLPGDNANSIISNIKITPSGTLHLMSGQVSSIKDKSKFNILEKPFSLKQIIDLFKG